MKSNRLSLTEAETGRNRYLRFTRLNAISFGFLADSTLILYAIKNGADDFLVGMLTSFFYLTMPFMFIGKRLVGRLGAARTYAISWALRNTSAAVMIAVPFVINSIGLTAGLALLVVGSFGFFAFRSSGLTANTPIIGEITNQDNRGSFIARIWLHFNIFNFLAVSILIYLLHQSDHVSTFQIIIALGALLGWMSAFLISRVPESDSTRISGRQPVGKALAYIWTEKRVRKLLFSWIASVVIIILVTPFTMVALKNGYQVSDYNALFYALLQIIGAAIASLINSLVLDRVGPRPMLILYSAGFVFSAFLWAIAPEHYIIYYPAIIFLSLGLCRAGSMTTLNHYFLSIVPGEKRVGANMLIYVISGIIAGLSGTFIGGGLLKLLRGVELSGLFVYRIYFIILIIILVPLWFVIHRLEPVADWRIRDVLGIFVSFRDIRALFTLQRLEKSLSTIQEINGVEQLRKAPSDLSESKLLTFLDSPRFTIRGKTLRALGQINFRRETAQRIIEEVDRGEFTTGYIAAEILGEHGIRDAIPVLRNALLSEDIYLMGKSMVALAQLKDSTSYVTIETIFEQNDNPRIIIHGAKAIVEMGDIRRLGLLLRKIQRSVLPAKVWEELLYRMCELCGCGEECYQFLKAEKDSAESGYQSFVTILQLFETESGTDLTAFKTNSAFLINTDAQSRKKACTWLQDHVEVHHSVVGDIVSNFLNQTPAEKCNRITIYCLFLILAKIAA